MNILVTGAAGFIGFSLCRRLLRDGHTVVGLDNCNDYYDVRLKEARTALLKSEHPGYLPVRGDITDGPLLEQLFAAHGFDRVAHLAAQAGVRHSLTHPFVYEQANICGFLHILERCRHARTPRLVYASSSSVYGGNTKMPFSEADRTDIPLSLYGATKKANELMAHAYSHLYEMHTVGLRFFTVYGPWGRPDMAMWLFADSILAGKPIPVFNHGEMRRDFTFVDDIVAGICGALFSDGLEKHEIFNLGNHRSERLLDMIAEIEKALGRKAVLDLQPMQPGDVPASFADVELAGRKLGFVPRTPISAGIPKFIEWYREYHQLRP